MHTVAVDLGGLAASGVEAILDALRLDRARVERADFDRATGHLSVGLCDVEDTDEVLAFVDGMRRTQKRLGRKVRWSTTVEDVVVRDIDAELAASADLVRLDGGLYALRGDLLKLFRWFERRFAAIAAEFEAEDQHYPVLVPLQLVSELGYLDHFPQHVNFCSHLRGSLPVLESVSQQHQSATAENLAPFMAPPGHVLTPAVCMPCYRLMRGERLKPGQVRTFTMQNHVFRYEGDTYRPLARAWDFTVRDLVFFGRGAQLESLRERVIERCLDLCSELGLQVSVELANDPFFLDSSRSKALYQRMAEVKYELLFPLPHRDSAIAASSFNLHRDFYTSIHGTVCDDDSPAESACMGFGLERWLYGFLTQKGLDPDGWPLSL